MTEPAKERNHGVPIERGHCKCCCAKWHPVAQKLSRMGPRYRYGPMFELHWRPSKRCTCQRWHRED